MRGQGHVTAGPSDRGAWLTWDTVDATYLARINPADLQDHTDERIRVEPRRGPCPGPWSSGSPDQNRPLQTLPNQTVECVRTISPLAVARSRRACW